MPDEPAPIKTFIYGSCVSRDTFGYVPSHFQLLKYVARQSLISAGTDASALRTQLTPIESAFQQRMVHDDLAGTLQQALTQTAPEVDLLLIDLVDERGGVIDLDGSYVTKLAEFWSAGGREATRGRPHLELGSDEHFALWSAAAERFIGLVRSLGLFDKVVVLRTPWADRLATGEQLEIPTWMTPPDVANARYERYFEFLSRAGLRVISMPPELARTPADHQWGPSPFHYTDEAYEFLAHQIGLAAHGQQTGSTATGLEASEAVPLPHLERRDTSEWGDFTEFDGVEAFAASEGVPEQLTIWQSGYPIDLMVEDNDSETTLVSFHAALGGSSLRPPIFTGRAISQHSGLNRIFVSDPGLLASPDLGLAWYLGTSGFNLTKLLSQVIAALQERLDAQHLVFFGMSGGGFAALNFAHEFPGSLAVPVNPQTRILDYAEVHWDAMARACFGAATTEESRQVLETHPRADQRRVYGAGFSNHVIYVQNQTDGHVINQMVPWFEATDWSPRATALMRDWGKGHIAPPAPELRDLLGQVAEVEGNWENLAARWGARPANREWIRKVSGR